MFSEAYYEVQEHFDTKGRGYYDGYPRHALARLDAQERAMVADQLRQRSASQDPIALVALGDLLPDAEFTEIAHALLQGEVAPPFRAYLLTLLAARGQQRETWNELLTLLQRADRVTQGFLLGKLDVLPLDGTQRRELAPILANLIRQVREGPVLLGAVVMLLKSRGMQPRSPSLITAAERLQAKDRREREKALSELGLP